jgi:hypothetical protein
MGEFLHPFGWMKSRNKNTRPERQPSRSMTKSPAEVVRLALEAAQNSGLPEYSHDFSRHDYTQAQLFAILVLQCFLGLDFRGIIGLLEDWPEMQSQIGLKKLPHYSTLCLAKERLLKKRPSILSSNPSSAWLENWVFSRRRPRAHADVEVIWLRELPIPQDWKLAMSANIMSGKRPK